MGRRHADGHGHQGADNCLLTIGSKTAHKNGTSMVLDVPARIVSNRTLVPLRFVSEALGASVDWDGRTQAVFILSAGRTRVHFIDVGQGDAVYISLSNNNDILIDGGDNAYGSTVVGYLQKEGVDDIEILIATHPHADHIGGLDDVLAAFDVELVIDSGTPADTATYRDYLAAVRAEGGRYEKARAQTWTFGSCMFKILGPVQDYGDANNNSEETSSSTATWVPVKPTWPSPSGLPPVRRAKGSVFSVPPPSSTS